jgi:hypothetical protein
VPTSFLCNFTVPDRAIFSKGLSTRNDEMKKKKKKKKRKNVLILLHTYFSPTTPPKKKPFLKIYA